MEIKVTIDSEDAQRATGQPPAGSAPSQEGAERGGPPPEVAAAAAAVGAIDAGPAHIPPGQSGQALPNVAATAALDVAGQGGQSALAAGAAPEYTREAEQVVEAEGEEEA